MGLDTSAALNKASFDALLTSLLLETVTVNSAASRPSLRALARHLRGHPWDSRSWTFEGTFTGQLGGRRVWWYTLVVAIDTDVDACPRVLVDLTVRFSSFSGRARFPLAGAHPRLRFGPHGRTWQRLDQRSSGVPVPRRPKSPVVMPRGGSFCSEGAYRSKKDDDIVDIYIVFDPNFLVSEPLWVTSVEPACLVRTGGFRTSW